MTRECKRFLGMTVVALAAWGMGLPVQAASAETFPSQPVQYIIPFGPGGESDVSARLQQPFFQKMFGQDLVISYKPGGGGAVGWSQLNSMPADGYTIMGVNLPHIIVKPMQRDVGFKTDDLGVFYMFHYTPDAIVVQKDSPFKSLKDLIDYAKENPGRVTFSGSGRGTANDLAHARFDRLAGIKTTYIPFKGTGASVTALLGGQVKAQWGYTTFGAQHPDNTRLLEVAMDKRHPLFPDVPTFTELGIDMVGGAYRGMAAPKATPEAIKQKLSDMFAKINADPEFQKKMIDQGFALVDIAYGQMAEFMAQKTKEYQEEAKQAVIIK
jgi:tripartite-type tricarboxylate transporter receptor subunit TctC